MDIQTRELIRARAQRLFPYLRDHLIQDGSDYSFGETYKFVYLVLRHPRAYLEAFREGDLKIDAEEVSDVYWGYRLELHGPHGLFNYERELIRAHNAAVDDYLTERRALSSSLKTAINTPTNHYRGVG